MPQKMLNFSDAEALYDSMGYFEQGNFILEEKIRHITH